MRNWDDEFANMAYVEGSEELPTYWAKQSAAYREQNSSIQKISYGSHEREYIDLVLPEGKPRGLLVFVHGGYWMQTSPSDWTYLAEGARARGWAVALPGYTLTPEVSITKITQQVTQAITKVAEEVSGPIVLSGHSAGGHLVARSVCSDSALPSSVLQRIRHIVPISGVFDLRPLLWTAMNNTLKLTDVDASTLSPVLLRPIANLRMTVWVGAAERPEFIRQSRLMCAMWEGLEANISLVVKPEENHFTVIEALREPSSALMNTLLDC